MTVARSSKKPPKGRFPEELQHSNTYRRALTESGCKMYPSGRDLVLVGICAHGRLGGGAGESLQERSRRGGGGTRRISHRLLSLPWHPCRRRARAESDAGRILGRQSRRG